MGWIQLAVTLTGVAALLLTFVSFFLPRNWSVERTILVQAPTSACFSKIVDLANWPKWTTFPGSSQSLSEIQRDSWLKYQGEVNSGRLRFEGKIDLIAVSQKQTEVHWKATGRAASNPLRKYLNFMMDDWIGPDLEDSLGNLKKELENEIRSAN